jgi:hypothetical protein
MTDAIKTLIELNESFAHARMAQHCLNEAIYNIDSELDPETYKLLDNALHAVGKAVTHLRRINREGGMSA